MLKLGKNRQQISAGIKIGQGIYFSQGQTAQPPAAPVATSATLTDYFDFTANWNASAGATGYYLDVSTASDFSSFVTGFNNLDVSNVTTYFIDTLDSFTTYYYRVRAYNGAGTSASSNTISSTTLGFLLDEFPSAAAAYSIRILSGSYYKAGGNLATIRRSSDNAEETFIPTRADGYVLTLNSATSGGTTLATWIGSESGFIKTKFDQSGNALDLTQLSASAQPQIINAGALITDNGKVAAQLTGNEEYIKAISWNTNLYSQFSVMSNSSAGSLITLDNGSIWLRDNGTAMFAQYSGNFFNATLTTTQQAIYHGYDGTNHIYNRNNGAESISATTTAQGTVTELVMFARRAGINRVSGKFQEAIFYLSDQSGNVGEIQNLQNNFYSIY